MQAPRARPDAPSPPEAASTGAAAGGIETILVVEDEDQLREIAREMLEDLGYTANTIAHRGVLDVGIRFLEKPYSMDSLARKVREVLAT